MTSNTIERDIEIDAPIEVVWRTITEPEQIRRWFSDAVDVEARTGALGTLTFGTGDANDLLVVQIAVVAVDPPRRFSFRWVHPPGVAATAQNSTLVTFTLTRDGDDRTTLRVVESGLEQLPWSDDEKQSFADQHRQGWQTRGDRLRALFSGSDLSP